MDKPVMARAIENYETPFYLFDSDACAAGIKKLRAGLGPDVDVCYAMKANPFLAGELARSVDFFEVCSPGEFRICERAGIPMEKIVLSGVYKNKDDICAMLDRYGSRGTYTAESLSQWNMLCECAGNRNLSLRVLLRLTSGNQFGLEREEIVRIVGGERSGSAKIIGIQFFSGTQKKSLAKIRRELELLGGLLDELRASFGFVPERLEYGPGFPVDYFGDSPGLEDEILGGLSDALSGLGRCGRAALEMGRAIAAPCGSYVTSVVDIKNRGGKRFCIVDGGIHQLNYYGQTMAMRTPPVTHWDDDGGEPVPWTVFGALCTVNDVLLREHPFSGLRVGSRLVFEKAGAYSVTEGPALLLSRDLPQVLLYSGSKGLRLARGHVRTDVLNSPEKEKEER
jgi:diaminopimelate decarboxylase